MYSPIKNNQTIDMMKAFTFIDTANPKYSSRHYVPDNIVRVHNKHNYKVVSFSPGLSKQLLQAGITSFRIANNSITGELAFVLDTSGEGHIIRKKKPSADFSTIVITGKYLVETLVKFFGKPNAEYLELELSDNNSIRPDVKFYTVAAVKENPS